MTRRDILKAKKLIRKNAKAHVKNGTAMPASEHQYARDKAAAKQLKATNKRIKKQQKEAKKTSK